MTYASNLTSYTTPSRQGILLKGHRGSRYQEYVGSGTPSPGHLLEIVNNAGAANVRKASTYGTKTPLLVAIEDALQGLTITDAYTSGQIVRCQQMEAGNVFQGRLAASAAAVVWGDRLISAGDGTFKKIESNAYDVLAAAAAASAAVTNTTVETTFSTGSYALAANTLRVGDIIRVRAQGIATATHSTDTLSVALYLGSTQLAVTGALDVANNDVFEVEFVLVVRTIGATGTFVGTGFANIGTAGTATVRAAYVASTAIDTTVANTLAVKATWSVADAGNSCRLDVFNVTRDSNEERFPLAVAVGNVDNSAGGSEVFCDIQAI